MSRNRSRMRVVSAFLRSLFIHSSWNFWRMQNLGFAFSMIPAIRFLGKGPEHRARMFERHLQLFNTNPCMSGPIIGSVMRIEEDLYADGSCPEADRLKTTLMAPYAAMGDSLFWGSLKPLAGTVGVLAAMTGSLYAGLVLLLIYNPLHLWVRIKGFAEGYRKGKDGIDFIRSMNLPRISGQIRWISVVLLGVLAWVVSDVTYLPSASGADIFNKGLVLGIILLCFWMVKKGVSALSILYGAFALLFVIGLP